MPFLIAAALAGRGGTPSRPADPSAAARGRCRLTAITRLAIEREALG